MAVELVAEYPKITCFFRFAPFRSVCTALRQISPPLTTADETVGRSVPSIGLPSEVGDAFAGVSSLSLAVAEWIIDPRQVGAENNSL